MEVQKRKRIKRYKSISVTIDAETIRMLDEISERWGTTRSDTIRRIVLMYYLNISRESNGEIKK
ncbi:MAG: ribbon-helix-helix protein, CopG family [Pyrobaculum sp.]